MAIVLQIILTLLQDLPMFEKWVQAIEQKLEEIARQKALKNFDVAALAAQSNKDTCELEKQFYPGKVCPAPGASPPASPGVQDNAPKN